MNICCLDRFTGRVLWTAEGNGETPGYTSPLLIHHGQRTLLVAYSELTLMGLDAATGELLWANPEFDTYFGGFVKKDHLLVQNFRGNP